MTYRHRLNPDGTWEVRARSNMEWVAPTMASKQVYRELYWAPYEFQIDGKISGEIRP